MLLGPLLFFQNSPLKIGRQFPLELPFPIFRLMGKLQKLLVHGEGVNFIVMVKQDEMLHGLIVVEKNKGNIVTGKAPGFS